MVCTGFRFPHTHPQHSLELHVGEVVVTPAERVKVTTGFPAGAPGQNGRYMPEPPAGVQMTVCACALVAAVVRHVFMVIEPPTRISALVAPVVATPE